VKKPFVLGWDTEDDQRGNPFLWCFVHEGGSTAIRHQADALMFLENCATEQRRRNRQLQAWATNLEYDLCNLFNRDRIGEVTLRFGRSYLCGARWRGTDFRDTVRHVPLSVAQLGELVGLKKLEGKLFEAPRARRTLERFITRCKRDAAITYRGAVGFSGVYRAFGQSGKMTLASTALRIWQERYWQEGVSKPGPEVWTAALHAYHGGRTQAFAHGTFARVDVIDVASMFPWAMVAGPMPLPWGLHRKVKRGDAIRPLGIYYVDVCSELVRPRLPVRTQQGTVYPNGRWRGWYVGEELIAFQRAGGTCRVLRGFEFAETCDPFRGYVGAMFRRKQRARGMGRIMYKLLLNSLYGKFGQQGRQVRAVTVERFMAMERKPLDARVWNGLVIYTHEGEPPPWSNNVWPAFVTARARVRLADEIERIAGAGSLVLYCDTDSVMFSGGRHRYPRKAAHVGDFELRGRYRQAMLVGKKEYALDCGRGTWETHAKGVPWAERMRYLREGVAEFERPYRMREAARSGEQVNTWRRVRKVRRVQVAPGVLRADGTLTVPRIGA
jgi:hypothetical protein